MKFLHIRFYSRIATQRFYKEIHLIQDLYIEDGDVLFSQDF